MTTYDLDTATNTLSASWSADTAYGPSSWSQDNPARGQCIVSCLVIQDYFGGDLVRYSVKGEGINETHYVNKLPNGSLLDTTASQYTYDVVFQPKPIELDGFSSIREKRLADADTLRRYILLRDRVKQRVQESS